MSVQNRVYLQPGTGSDVMQVSAHKQDVSESTLSSSVAVTPDTVTVKAHSHVPVMPHPWQVLLNDDGDTYYHIEH